MLRLPEGSTVRGLTPDGSTLLLQITYRPGGEVRLLVVGEAQRSSCDSTGTTVAVALIKRMAHLDFVIEKGTEIGVAAWWAVVTEHCADAGLVRSYEHRLQRWRRIAESASIQSGRSSVPPVIGVLSLPELFEASLGCGRRLVAVPGAAESMRTVARERSASTLFLVGPEGGWS
ncbi:MAG: RsmE family RNA methyltransferase, partial [Candidatus Eisenbacteria bacterium]|nr:RsmE family RNA methyltransferase [Candidatus Eisenbacteria bacterium]